jgi:hypothetical protein
MTQLAVPVESPPTETTSDSSHQRLKLTGRAASAAPRHHPNAPVVIANAAKVIPKAASVADFLMEK